MTALSPVIPLHPISDREFRAFQELIYREAGIHLSSIKKVLLTGRLAKRLRDLGLQRFQDYYERVVGDRSGAELVFLLDAITTNETQFFREPRQFDYLEQVIYPEWQRAADEGRRQRSLRIWSAACSSGEEPYSIAMSLLQHFPAESGWNLEIEASDISTRVLKRAEDGVWALNRSAHIPPHLLKRFMLRGTGTQEGLMKAGKEVRRPIRFSRLNLNEDSYAVRPGLDAIFCRNVLIYFDQASREHVVSRLLDLLTPEGYLFLGHAESLTGMNDRVRSVAPAIYTLRGAAAGRGTERRR